MYSWLMNQLFYNIFNPKENFFLEGYVCWPHECAQEEYEAHSCNWIWLDKFTSYVIMHVDLMFSYQKQTTDTCM